MTLEVPASSALVAIDETNPRHQALLVAIGFDKLSPAQRELGLSIAAKYDLDPLLKHIVMIEGRPYITRDGLLHVAHKSGTFDGIEATEPVLEAGFWRSRCSVYRKDFSRPFVYSGRYPEKGRNAQYGPEMAVKVAEVMCLRRAFDVAAPTVEERWEETGENEPVETPAPKTLAERIAEKAAATGVDTSDVETLVGAVDATDAEAEAFIAAVESPEQPPAPDAPTETAETPAVEPEAPTAPEPVSPLREEATEAEVREAPVPDPIQTAMDRFAAAVRDRDPDLIKATAKEMFRGVTRFGDLNETQLTDLAAEVGRRADAMEAAAEAAAARAETDEAAGPDPVSDPDPTKPVLCGNVSQLSGDTCTLDLGHKGDFHRHGVSESWKV